MLVYIMNKTKTIWSEVFIMKKTIAAAVISALLFASACAPAAPEAPAPITSAPTAPITSTPAPVTPPPGAPIFYNEVDAVVSKGTPFFNPDAYSESPSADEISELIHIDFEACLPESMEGSRAYYTASYHAKDELTEIVISVKNIEGSIANAAWSPNSIAHGSDYYKGADDKRSLVGDVSVDAYVWPAHVDTNPESGYYREWDAYYLAFFEVNGFKYYIEGREGVSEAEFSEFIAHIIESYTQ